MVLTFLTDPRYWIKIVAKEEEKRDSGRKEATPHCGRKEAMGGPFAKMNESLGGIPILASRKMIDENVVYLNIPIAGDNSRSFNLLCAIVFSSSKEFDCLIMQIF
jgi:hypothetical protein